MLYTWVVLPPLLDLSLVSKHFLFIECVVHESCCVGSEVTESNGNREVPL